MQKHREKVLLLLFYFFIVITGIFGDCFDGLVSAGSKLTGDFTFQGIADFKNYIDNIFPKSLSYHDALLDINSVVDNLENKRIIKKNDSTIVKSNEDMLIEGRNSIPEKSMNDSVNQVFELYRNAAANNSKFLYVAVPSVANFVSMPDNYCDYSRYNYDRYVQKLQDKGIPTLDLEEHVLSEGLKAETLYFITDHHWKPGTGLWATNKICEKLYSEYGFQYDPDLIDKKNYNIETYENLFLGSLGKKVGTYFTWNGADDFDVLIPNFDTLFCEDVLGVENKGDFSTIMLHSKYLENKGYYHNNAYVTYSGGDFRLQKIRNLNNTHGNRILIIRDSYACVVTPFLALNTSELQITDIRKGDWIEGKSFNIHNYIEQTKPDYVIVLYSEAGEGKNGKYDFKNEYNE